MSPLHHWQPGRFPLAQRLEQDVLDYLAAHPGWAAYADLLVLAPEGITMHIDDIEAETPFGSDAASGPVHFGAPTGKPDGGMLGDVITHLRDEALLDEGYPDGAGRSFRLYEDDGPVGLPEIAERLRVRRATADQWRTRGLLPEPTWTVGGRPAWRWRVIREWAAQTGRLPGSPKTSAAT